MSQTADIKAMLDWLASCPLATTLNDGDVVFSIEYLGADTEQMQFSLEATPRPRSPSRPQIARSGMNLPSG